MLLCTYCQSLPTKLFSSARNTQCTIDHQPSYLALKSSANAGCQLCSLFVHAINRSSRAPGTNIHGSRWSEDEAVTVRSTKFAEQVVQIGHKEAGKFRGCEVPLNWDNKIDPFEGNVSDLETRTIKYWREVCSKTHNACPESNKYIPTRVIDVGNDYSDTLRLVLTEPTATEDFRYLALSHCWGLNMPSDATTTSQTINQRLGSIELDRLPRTFVDFIKIARELGVRYVWIDSLCIIQDSREDWEKEAAQMASVYANAYLTVAASGSANGQGGCRTDEEERPYGPVDVECKDEENEDGRSKTFRIHSLSANHIVNVLLQDPLVQRGWTLQERELSPRVIHYSKDSIRWECQTLKASLQFPWDDSIMFNNALRIFDIGQVNRLSTEERSKTQKDIDRRAWFEMVGKYSKRSLTKREDLLPAISGIAQAVNRITGDSYLAGLWRSELTLHLLWASSYSGEKGLETHSRPPTFLAPSFSWASVIGPISYEWWIHSEYCLDPNPDPQFMPTILSAKTEPTGSDAYGMLKSGCVQLSGKIKPAISKGEGFAQQDREGLYSIQSGAMAKIGSIRYDVPSEAPLGKIKPLFCLSCLPRDVNGGEIVGIALQPADIQRLEFQRVGLFFAVQKDWWQDAPTLTITIL